MFIPNEIDTARLTSRIPMSLENLFMIVPVGFISKYKLIGALKMYSIIELWIFLEALTPITTMTKNVLKKTLKA